ncbi:hypothetical protein H0H92_012072 [Tricholoma furcatifolium]|nr:hypothetical protein H0H92_012072 [Tricholoma furcatifolium]
MSTTMPTTPTTRHRRHSSHPGFSHLLTTVLGSPFLTTSDLPELVDGAPLAVPYSQTITRPPSPTPTIDSSTFSFVQFDPSASTPNRPPFKSILPRIWDVISPQRLPYNSYAYSYGSQRDRARYFDGAIDYSELEPLDGEEGELVAVDDEACFFLDSAYGYGTRAVTGMDIIALLPPEIALHILVHLCTGPSALQTILTCTAVSRTWRILATDNAIWKALFLARWDVDLTRRRRPPTNPFPVYRPLLKLPELAIPADPPVATTPNKKRKTKRLFASDGPFAFPSPSLARSSPRRFFTPPPGASRPRPQYNLASPSSSSTPTTPLIIPRRSFSASSVLDIGPLTREEQRQLPSPSAPPPSQLDWYTLYRTRLELDRRWNGTALVPGPLSSTPPDVYSWAHHHHPRTLPMPMRAHFPAVPKLVPHAPQILSISGHADSVYCLEFDARRIVTGSRDRTIKVWSIRDGRLLGSFGTPAGAGAHGNASSANLGAGEVQGHMGSVLCLKFSANWDQGEEGDGVRRRGFMVSGSSDCSVCVWDLWTGARVGGGEGDGEDGDGDREVKGEMRAVLRGHQGGVLDLRIDDRWIVSCSKDAVIRVWDRETLSLVRVLRGHDGPVNAVGLQAGRVVSASGDGKMILWDIASGERIRTFEGHNRGLACIEFQDGLIVSGSNDCKIKIWNAETGECIRTLLGHEALVRALAFDSRSGRLVSASYDKTVKVWDLSSGRMVREFKNTHTSHIFDVKFDVSRIVRMPHEFTFASESIRNPTRPIPFALLSSPVLTDSHLSPPASTDVDGEGVDLDTTFEKLRVLAEQLNRGLSAHGSNAPRIALTVPASQGTSNSLPAEVATSGADFTINTPSNAVVCEPLLISWTGGIAPYYLSVVPAVLPQNSLAEFGGIDAESFTWTVNVEGGTSVGLSITDGNGEAAQSPWFAVHPGPNSDCLASSTSAPVASILSTTTSTVGTANSVFASTISGGSSPAQTSTHAPTGVIAGGVIGESNRDPTEPTPFTLLSGPVQTDSDPLSDSGGVMRKDWRNATYQNTWSSAAAASTNVDGERVDLDTTFEKLRVLAEQLNRGLAAHGPDSPRIALTVSASPGTSNSLAAEASEQQFDRVLLNINTQSAMHLIHAYKPLLELSSQSLLSKSQARATMSGADLTINTPANAVVCQQLDITWTGGIAPYKLSVVAVTLNNTLVEFNDIAANPVAWTVDVAVGTSIELFLLDSTDSIAQTSPFFVNPGPNSKSCLQTVDVGSTAAISLTVDGVGFNTGGNVITVTPTAIGSSNSGTTLAASSITSSSSIHSSTPIPPGAIAGGIAVVAVLCPQKDSQAHKTSPLLVSKEGSCIRSSGSFIMLIYTSIKTIHDRTRPTPFTLLTSPVQTDSRPSGGVVRKNWGVVRLNNAPSPAAPASTTTDGEREEDLNTTFEKLRRLAEKLNRRLAVHGSRAPRIDLTVSAPQRLSSVVSEQEVDGLSLPPPYMDLQPSA